MNTRDKGIQRYRGFEAWVHRQHPIVSSLTHGAIAAAWTGLGIGLAWLPVLFGAERLGWIAAAFYGMAIGAYLLREIEDGRRYLEAGDSKGFKDSVIDFFVPLCTATFIFTQAASWAAQPY
jgi:hypothetical protein